MSQHAMLHAFGWMARLMCTPLAGPGEASPSGLVSHLNSQGLLDLEQDTGTSRRGRCSVVVKRFQVGPATLFLAAQGAKQRSGPALRHAAGGVERILGELTPEA